MEELTKEQDKVELCGWYMWNNRPLCMHPKGQYKAGLKCHRKDNYCPGYKQSNKPLWN